MKILVTGGRGYIGSHACKLLATAGHKVFSLDNESRGRADISRWAKTFKVATRDSAMIADILAEQRIDAVMHFAAYAYVGESVHEPLLYFENNVAGTISLLQAMQKAGVRRLIFSSTCATYGERHGNQQLTEELAQEPVNPYGRSKLYCEGIIKDACVAHGLSAVAFRYFNAAGADPEGDLGEDHDPETHLIPLAIRAALKPGTPFTINGNNFSTPDGTAVRDYVHVLDIAEAHILGVNFAELNSGFHAFNLGNGRGYSILEVLSTTETICNSKIDFHFGPRRPGDPAMLVGNNVKAQAQLGWRPKFSSLESIIETAVAWERKHLQAIS